MRMRLALATALLLALAAPLAAQRPRTQDAPGRRLQNDDARGRLEQQIRTGFARAVRNRVGLTDDQMRRLAPISQRHEQQRRQLQQQERQVRLALRAEIEGSPDSTRVAQLLQDLVSIQRRRVEVLEAEQRDLATIMSPVQRARFLALQEQVRRRLEQLRQERAGAQRGGAGPP